MALAAKKTRPVHAANGIIPSRGMGVTAAAVVIQGAYLSKPADGYVNPAIVSEAFAGIAKESKTGGAADGDVVVQVDREGLVKDDVVGATAVGDEGALVYAIDDDTLTLTASTNVPMGRVEQWLGGTSCWVHFYVDSAGNTFA